MARPLTKNREFAVAAAQQASQSGIRELLALHEAKVISEMIAKHRSRVGLSPEDAKIGVAIIAELRSLGGAVDRAIEYGTQAGHQLTE